MSEARPAVPEDFSGTVTYTQWSATLLYRRKSGEVYGTRRHLAGTRGAAQALVRTMDAPHSHTEWVVQERTVTVTANVWADLPAAAPGTRDNPTQHSQPDPVDQAAINARVADDMGEVPHTNVGPDRCTRCGSAEHWSGHPYPVCSALYQP